MKRLEKSKFAIASVVVLVFAMIVTGFIGGCGKGDGKPSLSPKNISHFRIGIFRSAHNGKVWKKRL